MATAADKALHTTEEKANFQRLARLLMCGGLALLREVFDSIHPPANLPVNLRHPATVRQLKGARLTRAEREHIFLPTGGYGKSADFDITLLFRLLRTICNLAPPVSGWDDLPDKRDWSLVADLVRIKYYRNSIYGHSQTMEISDPDFADLWGEISEALLRIAGSFGNAKRDEWKKSIDNFRHHPLTPDAGKYVMELQSWYKKDVDTKDEMVKLTNEIKIMLAQLSNEQEQTKIRQEQLNAKQEQLNTNQEQMLEQIINIGISVESFKPSGVSISPGCLPNDPQLQEAGLQSERECIIPIPMEQPQGEVSTLNQSTGAQRQTNEQNLDFWHVLCSFKEPIILLVRYLKIKLGVDFQGIREGSLVITVSCSSLKVLEDLWEDYNSGHLSKVVQEILVTTGVLEELCLREVKLKTIISEEEYKACEEFFTHSQLGKSHSNLIVRHIKP